MTSSDQVENWVLNSEARVTLDLSTPVRGQEMAYRKYTSDQVPFLQTLQALIKSGLFQSLEQILDSDSLADCPAIPAVHLNYLKQMNILVRASELGRRPVYQVSLEQKAVVLAAPLLPPDLSWNPDIFVQWDSQWPPAFQPAPAFLGHLSGLRPLIWCRSLNSGCWFPYWARVELARVIEQQQAESIQGLGTDLIQSLVAAEILASPAALSQEESRIAALDCQLRGQGYVLLKALLPPLHLSALQAHLTTLRQEGFFQTGDLQVKARDTIHNEPVLRFFQAQICEQLLRPLGLLIQPSYNYLAYYHPGAVMPYHTDREQCLWNISLLIDQPTHGPGLNWPLYLQAAGGPLPILLSTGDALLYQGSKMPHWRDTLPGQQGVGVGLLHYVALDYEGSLR